MNAQELYNYCNSIKNPVIKVSIDHNIYVYDHFDNSTGINRFLTELIRRVWIYAFLGYNFIITEHAGINLFKYLADINDDIISCVIGRTIVFNEEMTYKRGMLPIICKSNEDSDQYNKFVVDCFNYSNSPVFFNYCIACTNTSNNTNNNIYEHCYHCFDCMNCYGCTECNYCTNCLNCTNCRECKQCEDCRKCNDCLMCLNCYNVSNSIRISNCKDSDVCNMCYNCSHCAYSYNCKQCENCHKCNDCNNCVSCYYCVNLTNTTQKSYVNGYIIPNKQIQFIDHMIIDLSSQGIRIEIENEFIQLYDSDNNLIFQGICQYDQPMKYSQNVMNFIINKGWFYYPDMQKPALFCLFSTDSPQNITVNKIVGILSSQHNNYDLLNYIESQLTKMQDSTLYKYDRNGDFMDRKISWYHDK